MPYSEDKIRREAFCVNQSYKMFDKNVCFKNFKIKMKTKWKIGFMFKAMTLNIYI